MRLKETSVFCWFFRTGGANTHPRSFVHCKVAGIGRPTLYVAISHSVDSFCRQESEFKKIQHTNKIRAFFNSHEFTLSHHETIFSIWCTIPGAAINGSSQRVFGCCWHRCRMQTAYIHLLTSMNENAQYSLGICVFEKTGGSINSRPKWAIVYKTAGALTGISKSKKQGKATLFLH